MHMFKLFSKHGFKKRNQHWLMTVANNESALYHGMPDWPINVKIPGVVLSSTEPVYSPDTREQCCSREGDKSSKTWLKSNLGKKKIYEMTMAFYMATGHESIGYLPSFTRVSNHSPPTYIFHVPHKKKPAAKIKYLIAIPLSKYTSVACCNLVVGRHRVLASCGCPAREGQAGLCPGPPDVIHPTHCTCVTPVTYSCEPTGAEGGAYGLLGWVILL